MRPRILSHASLFLAGSSLALVAGAADWLQFGHDPAHSGNNPDEHAINAANVSRLVPQYAAPVFLGSMTDGAPVYASGVTTAGGIRDLLFLFTTHQWYDGGAGDGTLFAIDAATGAIVWSQVTSGSSQHASSSPVVDAAKQYVYSFGLDGYVHKYATGDGSEVLSAGPAGWPAQVTLKPTDEKVAGSLAIASSGAGFLQVVLNGYGGDVGDYQGHLVSIDLASGTRKVFNALCSNVPTLLALGGCPQLRGGIWGRGGATFDAATGRIYVATGNGPFNAATGGFDWGDSVLAFAPDGSGSAAGMPRDSYTPTNYQQLESQDLDLGSSSLVILPVPAGSAVAHLGLQAGKDAKARLIDLDDMSGAAGPGHVGGELQSLDLPYAFQIAQPAVWTDPADGSTWVFGSDIYAALPGMAGLQLQLDGSGRPDLVLRWTNSVAAASPVVANNVLYAAGACDAGTCVIAREPTTGDVLWTSPPTGPVKWASPIVVDGAVYVTDQYSQLWKFGLPDRVFGDGFDGT